MAIMTEKKTKEWREWGKEAYRSSARMMRSNRNHPDYDTKEKRDALHDLYDGCYLIEESHARSLKEKRGYTDEDVSKAREAFMSGYDASRAWYAKEDAKQQKVLDRWDSVFRMAESLAEKVDVSDISDGFPCGSAHLYLSDTENELARALAHFFYGSSSSPQYKYRLPIKMPAYGQCVNFDTRICNQLIPFLESNGLRVSVHTWID